MDRRDFFKRSFLGGVATTVASDAPAITEEKLNGGIVAGSGQFNFDNSSVAESDSFADICNKNSDVPGSNDVIYQFKNGKICGYEYRK